MTTKVTGMTPGPWAVSKIGNNYDQYSIYSEATNEDVCNTVEGGANARAIAKLPELVEALREGWTLMPRVSEKYNAWIDRVDALLATIEKKRQTS